MNVLFLDDREERVKIFKKKMKGTAVVKVCYTAQQCIDALSTDEVWNIVFLDHDLNLKPYSQEASDPTSGSEVVRWIIANEPLIRNIIVHSTNGPRGGEMVQKLQEAQYKATYLPFETMIANLEKING